MQNLLKVNFALVLVLLVSSGVTRAQASSNESGTAQSTSFIGLYNCEDNSAMLDMLANELRSSNERSFVIARLGRGEASREISRRRLYNVRTYLEVVWSIKPERLLFAEGEKVAKEGRVEVYVGSRLLFTSLVQRGRDMCVTCCDANPAYYGMGKRDKPSRRRQ